MLEKSVSEAEEKKFESNADANRKKSSPAHKSTVVPYPSRAESRERSVGAGCCNEGSNRNHGRSHESDSAPVPEAPFKEYGVEMPAPRPQESAPWPRKKNSIHRK